MATDTPNFNWPIPEDTDLVKDGAKAIRDLGNAIDTSAQDFGGGLVHINTQTFTGVSAIKFENVFSSAYRNYRFVADFLSNDATNRAFFARYLVGTTPESSALYGVTRIRRDFGSTTVTGQNADFNDTAIVWAPAIANTGRASISGDIKLPSVSTRTLIDYSGFIPDSGNFYFYVGSSNIGATTVFDGIEFFIGTPATFSGQISIYGYKD